MGLKRQEIVDAIKTRMRLINGVGNYYLNCSDNVYVQRSAPFEDSELPGINIMDGDESPNQELLAGSTNVWYRSLNVEIRLVTNGELSDEDVRKGIADIQRAIGTDLTWGGFAIDTTWLGTVTEKSQEEQKITSATVSIMILYLTGQWAEE